MSVNLQQILSLVKRALRFYKQYKNGQGAGSGPAATGTAASPRTPNTMAQKSAADYPGDYRGKVRAEYNPQRDGNPDPGEIVWSWVPYEEDFSQGKDRPVLLIGRDGPWLLALMLTSKDHTNDTRRDPDYVDIGTGDWDRQGRDSEVKLDRVVRVSPEAVRREGAVLERQRFERVLDHLNSRS